MQLFQSIMFRDDNTEGYTPSELAALNAELAERIADLDDGDLETAQEIAKAFNDEVSRR